LNLEVEHFEPPPGSTVGRPCFAFWGPLSQQTAIHIVLVAPVLALAGQSKDGDDCQHIKPENLMPPYDIYTERELGQLAI
jgi:hypothetical protein